MNFVDIGILDRQWQFVEAGFVEIFLVNSLSSLTN